MMRRAILVCVTAALFAVAVGAEHAQAQNQQRAYGRVWGNAYGSHDWERFYHYPYVFYPHNYWAGEYFRSSESLYYRYPPEMRVPVYNKQWHNYYPEGRPHDNLRTLLIE